MSGKSLVRSILQLFQYFNSNIASGEVSRFDVGRMSIASQNLHLSQRRRAWRTWGFPLAHARPALVTHCRRAALHYVSAP